MAACAAKMSSPTAPPPIKKPISTPANTTPLPWQQRLFGKQLAKCDLVTSDAKPMDAMSLLGDEVGKPISEVIGLYFTFINDGATCDDFTKQLVDLYASLNGDNDKDNGETPRTKRKRFEVVHVVLWSNVADVLDFEESFRNHVADLPWLAVPNRDYERKVRNGMLSQMSPNGWNWCN